MSSPIGDAFRSAREQRGQTQQAVARAAGTNQATVSGVETTQIDPRLSTLQRLALALDLEVVLIPRSKLDAVRRVVAASVPADSPAPSSLREMFSVPDDAP